MMLRVERSVEHIDRNGLRNEHDDLARLQDDKGIEGN